jgi:hypothetical protein
MHKLFVCLAGVLLIAACSKAPAPAQSANANANAPATPAATPQAVATPTVATTGPAVSGTFTGNGKPATLTQVTAHKDDPSDGQPVTALVFSSKDQGGDDKAAFDALFDKFGDAIVVKVEPDGTIVGADVMHSALKSPSGSISLSGVLKLEGYSAAGGQISGHLTSGGPVDVFDQKLEVDLTFHTKAP